MRLGGGNLFEPAAHRRTAIARTEYAIKGLLAIGSEIRDFATTRGVGGAPGLRRERVVFCYWRAVSAAATLPARRGRTDQPLCKDEA